METGTYECEDCGWTCTLDGDVLNPECDNCGGELVPVTEWTGNPQSSAPIGT